MKIKKILVSQPKPESEKSPYFDIAEKYNVTIDFRPFIKVDPISAIEFRQQKVNIGDHNAVVFTSRHAVDHFFRLANETRTKISMDMQYFCVSEKVANYLHKYIDYRKRKVHYGTTNLVRDMFPVILRHKELNFLVVLSADHNNEISDWMDSMDIKHSVGMMYRTVSNDFTEEEAKNFDCDMLVFFSPTGIKSFTKNFPGFKQGDVRIATFGPATAKAVADEGLRLDLEAPTKEHPSMTSALKAYLEKNKK